MQRWSSGRLCRFDWQRIPRTVPSRQLSVAHAPSNRPIEEIGTSIQEAIVHSKQPVAVGPSHGSLLDQGQQQQSRHLLRGILRECTYLPDSFARKWTREYVTLRFRKYGYKAWKHRNDPSFDERLQRKLREARAGLGLLRRANEGEKKPLLKVLLMAYGRVGKRRHDLMVPLMPTVMSRELAEAVHEASGEDGDSDGPGPAQSAADEHVSDVGTHLPSAAEVNKGQWTAYARAFTPQMAALLRSQIQKPPPHLTRPGLRNLRPRVDELNSWLRPMPRSRVKNQVKAWYAGVLHKAHSPLPTPEWERLHELATGKQHERFVPRRQETAPSQNRALELVVMYGKPNAKRAFGNRDAHKLTSRYVQRLQAQVFSQCPMMQWDAEKMEWRVIWGHEALHRSNGRTAGLDTEATQLPAEADPSVSRHDREEG